MLERAPSVSAGLRNGLAPDVGLLARAGCKAILGYTTRLDRVNRLGVVIPTRNSEAHLPRHLDALQTWLDLADQVVVVDSQSTDRTMDMLRARLQRFPVQFLSHPPGLYASWNHGISNLNTQWTYMATVGDTISRSGIERLLEVAETLNADVVCSPPRWVKPDGSVIADGHTPVSEMAAELGLPRPARLTPAMLVAYCARFALVRGLNTPLCSSASDLYRTSVLTGHPFPTDQGSAGDAFWLLLNATHVNYALVPETVSDYLAHPSQHAAFDLSTWQSRLRHAARLSEANVDALRDLGLASSDEVNRLQNVLSLFIDQCEAELNLERIREGPLGKAWGVRPDAWVARHRRNQARLCAGQAWRECVGALTAEGRAFTHGR